MNHSVGTESAAAQDTGAWLPENTPEQLGGYRIVRLLGRGGMGMVFEGFHPLLGQRVAIKVLSPALAQDSHFGARFRREMTALGQIPSHPHLVRAQYAGEERGVLYLAMDFVDGEDLGHILQRQGRFSTAQACEAVRQAALGLDAIHNAGLVHRDIKPSNLILARDGAIRILDLGLARMREPLRPEDELTPTNAQLGTFDYLAPEQADDPRRVDIRADIYSLGCTLYALLQGQPPFSEHRSAAKKIYAHAHLALPLLGPQAPAGLHAVLARMTAKAPQERYAIPREVVEALAPFTTGANLAALLADVPAADAPLPHQASTVSRNDAPAPRTTVPPLPAAKRSRSRVWTWIIPGACAVLLLALAAVLLYHAVSPKTSPGAAAHTPEPQRDGLAPVPATDPILAAGKEPRPLDDLSPFDLHDLLDRPPVQAYWDPADGTAYRNYDAARRQLIVHSPGQALFHLGRLDQPSFTLRVQVKQTQWEEGAGVYLGYHDTASDPPTTTFQYLLFAMRLTGPGKTIFAMNRGLCHIAPNPVARMFSWSDVMGEDIETPRQEADLTIEVVGRRLNRVLVNGMELKKLTSSTANRAFTEADFRGGLGLLCKANSCVFDQASLKVLPAP